MKYLYLSAYTEPQVLQCGSRAHQARPRSYHHHNTTRKELQQKVKRIVSLSLGYKFSKISQISKDFIE
jgi:hypothetical protein